MEELVKIVRCIKKKGHTVFPIFYHVKATDVENQTGDYKQAFDDHEKEYSKKMGMVQSWRYALREVAGIAGWSARNYFSEAELVRLVVKQIYDKSNPTYPGTSMQLVPLNLNSMYLYQEWDEIQIEWICGMAGMGNTTFARAVYDAVTTRVSEKCGLGPVQFSPEYSVEWSTRIWDPSSEINAIKKKLQHKKVLLIVDDVDKQEHLVDLARKDELFGPGSRIIVSTTDPDKNTLQINVFNVSFERQMGRESKIGLDVVLFLPTSLSLKEMNVHAIRILGSLFRDGLPTKLACKFMTQRFEVSRHDIPGNLPTGRGIVLVEIGGNIHQPGEDESILEGSKEATKIQKGNINEKRLSKQIDDSTSTTTS